MFIRTHSEAVCFALFRLLFYYLFLISFAIFQVVGQALEANQLTFLHWSGIRMNFFSRIAAHVLFLCKWLFVCHVPLFKKKINKEGEDKKVFSFKRTLKKMILDRDFLF